MYDDGFGNLKFGSGSTLTGSGTIDYDSGSLSLTNVGSLSNFAISAIGLSGLACGANSGVNMLTKIQARSVNNKRDAIIRVVAFDS